MNALRWMIVLSGLLAALLLAPPARGAESAGSPAEPTTPGLYWSLPGERPRPALPVVPPLDRPPRIELPPWTRMDVGLEVLVDGRPLPHVHRGGRTYVVAPGHGVEYTLRVWNRGPRRITALVSVDGLSVITGRPSGDSAPGYIVSPHGSILIKGWRRDLHTVAAFRFEPREDSYAWRMGHPSHIGEIELTAIEELTFRPRPLMEEYAPGGASAMRIDRAADGTGTGYGRDIHSDVYRVPFLRGSHRRVITYHYATTRELGYELAPRDLEFAPPPPGRR